MVRQQDCDAAARITHRVLVIDDIPDAADSVCNLLVAIGHDARAAYSGRAALEEAARFSPDIVLLDLELPDLSGFEVARLLRARANGPLHLAAVTGWGRGEDLARTFAAGFDQHVLKPTDLSKLEDILRRATAMK